MMAWVHVLGTNSQFEKWFHLFLFLTLPRALKSPQTFISKKIRTYKIELGRSITHFLSPHMEPPKKYKWRTPRKFLTPNFRIVWVVNLHIWRLRSIHTECGVTKDCQCWTLNYFRPPNSEKFCRTKEIQTLNSRAFESPNYMTLNIKLRITKQLQYVELRSLNHIMNLNWLLRGFSLFIGSAIKGLLPVQSSCTSK